MLAAHGAVSVRLCSWMAGQETHPHSKAQLTSLVRHHPIYLEDMTMQGNNREYIIEMFIHDVSMVTRPCNWWQSEHQRKMPKHVMQYLYASILQDKAYLQNLIMAIR
jgi:hypothetical protein